MATLDEPKSDFTGILVGLGQEINFKIAIFVFIIGLLIFSDVYVKSVLSLFDNTTDSLGSPNSKGTGIQMLFLTLAYIIIDLLARHSYI